MFAASVRSARWHSLAVTPKTCWSFVELDDEDGRVGTGEATLRDREPAMAACFEAIRPDIEGRRVDNVVLDALRERARSSPQFAVVSAIDVAIGDLSAQRDGRPLADVLGGIRTDAIESYANINRGTTPRTPDRFADRARDAVAAGYRAIKIAPFDGVKLHGDATKRPAPGTLEAGIARIASVREAIGDDVALMVDCHWRLNADVARTVLAETAPMRLYWLECPLPETPEHLPALRAVRAAANRLGVRTAGCEEMSLVGGFAPFLDAGAYDVMMPDVKYVGGLAEMLRVAEALRRAGVGFSPHNPSGPVCHAASLHVCATLASSERLEMQYDETPLFDALVRHAIPTPRDGRTSLPSGAGLGVHLDASIVRQMSIPAR